MITESYLKSVQRKYEVSPWLTRDDIKALCMEALHNAEVKYDPSLTVPFEVYQKMHIRWALTRPYQEALEEKARHFPLIVTMGDGEEREVYEAAVESNIEGAIHLKEVREAIMAFARKRDRLDRAIIRHHLLGDKEMSDVGKLHGVSKQAVWLRRNVLMQELRKVLEAYR